jgi:putative phage-type endonuclease
MNNPNVIVQGTDEWFAARRGKVTASRVADVMARTKSGFAASRSNYKAELLLEILTNTTAVGFVSEAMKWGTEQEPNARALYASTIFDPVVEVGFIDHPDILGAGCSPDGLVGDDGIVEIKCPNTATFLEIFLTDNIPQKWLTQIQMQLDCTGRKWCDFVCYDPRMPEGGLIYVQRVERDEMFISTMREMIQTFIKELNEEVEQVKTKIKENQNA